MKRITLTFDNGPDPVLTHHVLDVLAEHGLKSTFFVIGSRLRLNQPAHEAVQRAHDEGHWIGNHGYFHAYSLGDIIRDDAVEYEFEPVFRELGDLADPRRLIRPYCYTGTLDHRVFKPVDIEKICAKNYTCVLYNSVAREWEGDAWPRRVLDDAASREWTTVVVHDIAMNPGGVADQPIAKLDQFIRLAQAEGFEFRQEFSPDVVLMAEGQVRQNLDHLVRGSVPEPLG